MGLDEHIQRILKEREGRILLLDDRIDLAREEKNDRDYREHVRNEDEISLFLKEPRIKIMDGGFTRFLKFSTNDPSEIENVDVMDRHFEMDIQKAKEGEKSFELMVIRPEHYRNLKETLEMFSTANGVADNVVVTPSNNVEASAVSKCATKINGGGVEFEPVDFDVFPTLMHYFCYKITGEVFYEGNFGISCSAPRNQNRVSKEQHEYKNSNWKEQYLQFIDSSLRAGNSQTEMDYTFMVFSDREIENLGTHAEEDRKIVVKPSDYMPAGKELENCAAIFVDNEWDPHKHGVQQALGDGIETLKRIRVEGKDVPVIYVSGHDLDAFTEEEKSKIESLDGILASKDTFPKVYRDKEKAENEIKVSGLVEGEVGKYTANVKNTELIEHNGVFVTYTEIADSVESDPVKLETFYNQSVEDDQFNHRMYVLGMFHENFKDKTEEFEETQQFKDFDELAERGADEELRDVYEKVASRSDLNEITTVAHNDAKSDNWFEGMVLGDFGDAGAGNEYRDIARALLDYENNFENVKNLEWVKEKVQNYGKLRGIEADERFMDNVYCMIFTEALREGSKKNDLRLKNVAKHYHAFLSSHLE